MRQCRTLPRRAAALLVSGVAAAGLAAPAAQATVMFASNSTVIAGDTTTAFAAFTLSGTNLQITLTNTSPMNALENPTSTLSGLQFTLPGDPALTPQSATSPNAIFQSQFCTDNPCTSVPQNVAGEWGYQNNFGSLERVGSAGYITTGLPGDIGNFGPGGTAGLDLQPPNSLDGIEFGILSAAHGALNGGLAASAMIVDTAVFDLTVPAGTTESQIANVAFLYGTGTGSSADATIPGVPISAPIPEPTSLALLGSALAGLGWLGWRRRKRVAPAAPGVV